MPRDFESVRLRPLPDRRRMQDRRVHRRGERRAIASIVGLAHRPCPDCQTPGRLLVDASEYAHVEYYRCDTCGQVWSYDKADPNGPRTPVTTTKTKPAA